MNNYTDYTWTYGGVARPLVKPENIRRVEFPLIDAVGINCYTSSTNSYAESDEYNEKLKLAFELLFIIGDEKFEIARTECFDAADITNSNTAEFVESFCKALESEGSPLALNWKKSVELAYKQALLRYGQFKTAGQKRKEEAQKTPNEPNPKPLESVSYSSQPPLKRYQELFRKFWPF